MANETLLGNALSDEVTREKTQLATKFGLQLGGSLALSVHGDPCYVRAACEASLKRLQVDCIDLYYQHRVDPNVPNEEAVGELKKLVEEGKIKYVGLSEASASTIRRAHAVNPITAVQLEWSLWTRDVEEEIVPTCRELGIGIVAYSPLGRGFFSSGVKLMETLSDDDSRKFMPRFEGENMEHNQWVFEKVNEIARRKGCTASQLALAWVHHQGTDVCPIPGTTKIENLEQNIGALSVKLTHEEMSELESLASEDNVKGDRYRTDHLSITWKELGIGIVAYSPLGRGFFSSGAKLMETLSHDDARKFMPRFQGENMEHNERVFEKVNEIARRKGCTASQLALAWVHHQGTDVCPIPGTTKIENLEQNIGALSVKLAHEEMSEHESLASEDNVKEVYRNSTLVFLEISLISMNE
ncbi:hypothetical protein Scep_029136 [Stephania cephalantha]|uniref:NADP-dependent oxidoreductase domain-containing protein n=1 Tax=Stephania cephalantha TaxID=152367 RepID=A0AAP0HH98_9MAGN